MSPTTTIPSLAELAFGRFPIPALILDDRDRIHEANPGAVEMLQIGLDELKGHPVDEVIQTDDPTWFSTDPVDQLATPSIGRELDARVGGKRRRFRVAVYDLDETHERPGRLVIIRDADEEDGDREEVQSYRTTLEELCACVAHEIRNPLTGIRTTVQFVGSKLEESDPRSRDLSEVLKEMDRIEEIIGDLLRFGRPVEFTKVESDLNALVGRVLDTMEPQLAEAEIQIQRSLSDELREFPFSPDNLQQVLLNLIRNSMEAMPEGGRIKVSTQLRRFRSGRPPEADLLVIDTGHGVPEDLLDEIFKPFFTTRHNGTGLGLPISLAIVRAHGGRMTVRNRAQGGSVFRIALPIGAEDGKA